MASHAFRRVIYASLIGNGLIAFSKFSASAFTGSSVMLSEAIHSVVHACNQVLLLYGLRRSARGADDGHPFGYGRELYFWAFVVAILIFATGSGIALYEGVDKVMHPRALTDPVVNYIVLGLAVVFEAFALRTAVKEFNRMRGETRMITAVRHSKDPAVFTVLFEHVAALIGLIIALAGLALAQYLDIPWLDGAASIGIGTVLAVCGIFLVLETRAQLIGEAASDVLRTRVQEIIANTESVRMINELRTMHMGPREILLALSLDFHDQLKAGKVEESIYMLERAIKSRFPEITRVFIEVQSQRSHDSAGDTSRRSGR